MGADAPNENGKSGGMHAQAKPAVEETTIKTEVIQIERKTFVFSLKENPRGRFLRITEDVKGRRDAIIVPAPGLKEFRNALESIARAAEATPTEPPPS